jgi:tight adherence protein B
MTTWLAAPGLIAPLIQFGTPEKLELGMGVGLLVILAWSLRSTFAVPITRRQALARLQPYLERDENLSPLERLVERAEADQKARGPRSSSKRRGDLLPTVSKWIAGSRIRMLNTMSADLTRIGSNWRPSEILYFGAALSLFSFLIIGIGFKAFAMGIFCAVLAFFIPFWMVRFGAKRWVVKFEKQLADTLLLMANATAAGYGFQQAMEMVAREGLPPMSEEFAKMNQEVRLGVPIAEALTHMSERVQNRDLTLTCVALIIAMEVGGAISDILRSISETMRERVRIRGEISVLSTQGKMTGAILAFMPIALFFLLSWMTKGMAGPNEPGYMDPLFNGAKYPLGPKLVAVGVVMEVLGFWIIQRIVSIEV